MEKPAPKRILALDGGGIRGALTLGFLEEIERIVRKKENNPQLKLCDYFDLIGGTSTGAIIAAGLAVGMNAADLTALYLDIGDKIFGKRRSWLLNPMTRYKAEFDFQPLEDALTKVFGNITMGSEKIKTGLCIVTKRADTLSTWPILSDRNGKFFSFNRGILLRQAVRASAAAPSYFVPQKIDVGNGEIGVFIDGGVSLANNPGLLLFLVATLKEFPYKWEKGEDKIELVSVGTGTYTKRYNIDKTAKMGLLGWASIIPDIFMEDAGYLNQTMLQYMSNSPTAVTIDSEILDLKNDLLPEKPALYYLRYNVMLETNPLQELGFNFSPKELESLREMSDAKNKDTLYQIGARAAIKYINADHFRQSV